MLITYTHDLIWFLQQAAVQMSYPHRTDEETEAQGHERTWQTHAAVESLSPGLRPVLPNSRMFKHHHHI